MSEQQAGQQLKQLKRRVPVSQFTDLIRHTGAVLHHSAETMLCFRNQVVVLSCLVLSCPIKVSELRKKTCLADSTDLVAILTGKDLHGGFHRLEADRAFRNEL